MCCRRQTFVAGATAQLQDSSGVILSAAQRRRRSTYFQGAAGRCSTIHDSMQRPAVGIHASLHFGVSCAQCIAEGLPLSCAYWRAALLAAWLLDACNGTLSTVLSRVLLCRVGPAQGGADAALPPALVQRPGVAAWLERELLALLLDDDVALVASHLLGTVRALSAALPPRPQRAPRAGAPGLAGGSHRAEDCAASPQAAGEW